MNFGLLMYVVNGLLFAGLFALMLVSWRGRPLGAVLLGAAAATVFWSFVWAWQAFYQDVPVELLYLNELFKTGAWIIFLQLLLQQKEAKSPSFFRNWWATLVIAMLMLFGIIGDTTVGFMDASGKPHNFRLTALLISALVGLVLVEQVFRNAEHEARWALRPLCIGIGIIFAVDIFLYSDGLLLRSVVPEFWAIRGAIVAVAAPLIVVATRRNPSWSLDLFISRSAVFYASAISAVGAYLVVMALLAFLVRAFGGTWNLFLQTLFLIGAGVLLWVVLFSTSSRRRTKVFLSKHFYRNKYDYREEWLKLIAVLDNEKNGEPLKIRAVRALSELVGSSGGELWLQQENTFSRVAIWGLEPDGPDEGPADSALVHLLGKNEWIIDTREYLEDPSVYDGLELPEWLIKDKMYWLIVPISQANDLIGFMRIAYPSNEFELTYEDIDLFRTIGTQIGSYLAREEAMTRLMENRQFEAYNRLTSFLMHDLKNVISQQSLVVQNARIHRRNPEFVDDAFLTISNSVQRMNRLLSQLKSRSANADLELVDLRKVITESIATLSDRRPEPELASMPDGDLRVTVGPEQLRQALHNLIRNAQDACDDDDKISVSVLRSNGVVEVEIKDSGTGMDEKFLRNRLYKPFDSTKGARGMGIGAHQAREFARASGGELRVTSIVGKGTCFTLSLPLTGDNQRISPKG